MIDGMSEFEKHTTMSADSDGRTTIKCNKGLWEVNAPNKSQATMEALHYFLQYYSDGEYSEDCAMNGRIREEG